MPLEQKALTSKFAVLYSPKICIYTPCVGISIRDEILLRISPSNDLGAFNTIVGPYKGSKRLRINAASKIFHEFKVCTLDF